MVSWGLRPRPSTGLCAWTALEGPVHCPPYVVTLTVPMSDTVADPGIAGGGYYQGRRWRDRRSRARRGRREASECRGGLGLGRGAVAPPQYGGLGAMPQKIFKQLTLKSRIFRQFCKLKWFFCSGCKAGLDNRHWSSKNATHCMIAIHFHNFDRLTYIHDRSGTPEARDPTK